MISRNEKIKVGVVGVGRGKSFMGRATDLIGMELVAICDKWEEKLNEVGREYPVATYTDYEKFLEHDMDAVILANYFHEHAPFAIKALAAGKHVMTETACNATLAEGVALCRAVEASGKIYMLAENYPYVVMNQELKRLYEAGEIGEALYAEGEYIHPMERKAILRISPGLDHWRNNIPSTYYCTHALAPLMFVTGLEPVAVNGFSLAFPQYTKPAKKGDLASVIICRMNNGAVFRLAQGGLGGHSVWYRIHGPSGGIETTRGHGYWGPGQVRVWHEPWMLQPGQVEEKSYVPEWPDHADLAKQAGHGGGDFWTNLHFARAIRSGEQPYLDVYRGVSMSSVGILAWKSALQNGAPVDMPDFRDEKSRKAYEHDNWSSLPKFAAPGQPPASTLGEVAISEEALAEAQQVWRENGYEG